MAYKVIQWSTGNVGRHALRLIAEHPDLELVGLWVHSADKAGRDAGELGGYRSRSACSRPTTPTRCSRSTPTASVTPRPPICDPTEAIADMARIAASGKNIVSSSVVPLVYPPHVVAGDAPAARRRVREAGVSCFTSGIDPGWANDLLPLVLTGQCEYIDVAARDGGRQLRDVRAADGALRHDGLRPGARRARRCC